MELLIDLTGRIGGQKNDWQPGDVVVACPDGWKWSELERTNPKWAIVKVPDMPKQEAESLASPELPKSLSDSADLLQRRQFKFDVDALKVAEGEKETYTLATVRTVYALKEPLVADGVKVVK